MYIDTHCHLNFKRFKGKVEEVIVTAKEEGVHTIIVPGTDFETSQKAIEIANGMNIFAAVGIHPHHVYEVSQELIVDSLKKIEELVAKPNVVAIGEIGIDRHIYEHTKYEGYKVDGTFVDMQKTLFREQVKLTLQYKKSLIIHNREAKQDTSGIMRELWDDSLEQHAVFHCCEPDEELLKFAKEHNMFLGVDGDVTYWKEKQEFIKHVPLTMLVLETDAPFLLPEPLKSQKRYPNEPKNIPIIAQCVAQLKDVSVEEVARITTENAKTLFQLPKDK